MLTKKLRIVTRIYKQFDPSFSLICYYSFIFRLLRISIGLSVFGFVANEYQQRAIRLLSTIRNIWSAIWWVIPKVILNYSRLPRLNLEGLGNKLENIPGLTPPPFPPLYNKRNFNRHNGEVTEAYIRNSRIAWKIFQGESWVVMKKNVKKHWHLVSFETMTPVWTQT